MNGRYVLLRCPNRGSLGWGDDKNDIQCRERGLEDLSTVDAGEQVVERTMDVILRISSRTLLENRVRGILFLVCKSDIHMVFIQKRTIAKYTAVNIWCDMASCRICKGRTNRWNATSLQESSSEGE